MKKKKYNNFYDIEKFENSIIGYIYQVSYIEDWEESPNFNKPVYYIGQHRTSSYKLTEDELINDGYFGSGKRIKAKIYKNSGDTSFIIKEILEYPIFGQSNLDDAERYWIQQSFEIYKKQLLNIEKGGRDLENTSNRFLRNKEKKSKNNNED